MIFINDSKTVAWKRSDSSQRKTLVKFGHKNFRICVKDCSKNRRSKKIIDQWEKGKIS